MDSFEQVPHTTVTRQDDGIRERLHVLVKLPGISSVSEFTVRIQPASLKLHSPGKYQLDLKLDALVEEKPEVLKFVKKRSEFKAVLLVVESAVPQQQPQPSRPEQPALHESFLAEAAKLRDTSKKKKAGRGRGGKPVEPESEPEAEPEPEPEPDAFVEWRRPRRRNRRVAPEPASHEPDAAEPEAAEADAAPVENLDGPCPPSESCPHRDAGKRPPADSDDPPAEARPAAPADPGQESAARSEGQPNGSAALRDLVQEAMAALRVGEHERAAVLARAAIEAGGMEDPRLAHMLESFELLTQQEHGQASPSLAQEEPEPLRPRVAEEASSPKPSPASPKAEESPADASSSGKGGSQPRRQRSKKGKQREEAPSTPRGRSQGKPSKESRQESEGGKGTPPQPEKSPGPHAESARATPQPEPQPEKHTKPPEKGWRAVRSFLWALLMLVCKAVLRRAPSFLADAAALLKWTRLARFLAAKGEESSLAGSAVTVASCLACAAVSYCAASAAALAVYMAHASVMASLASALYLASALTSGCLTLAKRLLWAPSLWTSAFASLMLRFTPLVGGLSRWSVITVAVWGWPLMMLGTGGGLLGWLTLPAAFLASMWDTSQWNLIAAFWLTRKLLVWLRLPLILARIASLLLGGFLLLLLQPLDDKAGRKSGGKAGGEKVSMGPRDVPEGAQGEVARVLAATDLYEVLLVPREADAETLRKAKRAKALATHPDKLGQAAGSNEAFARVTEAYEVLSDGKRREEYDLQLEMQAELDQMQSAAGVSEAQEVRDGLAFMCPTCMKGHVGRFVNRPLHRARYCAQCRDYHPAKEGEGWYESSLGLFGRKTRMYVCLEGKVVDMTPWAECTFKSSGSQVEVNTHEPAFDFSADLRGRGPSSSSRHGKKGRKGRRK